MSTHAHDLPNDPYRGHYMLDLEFLANRPDAAILQIGIVEFHPYTGEIFRSFESLIDLQSEINAGARIEGDTVMWWMAQNDDARRAVCPDLSGNVGLHMAEACQALRAWLASSPVVTIWGNGAIEDNCKMEEAYRRNGQRAPWSHRANRCYRTLREFASLETQHAFEPAATPHNALQDAEAQAVHLAAILRELSAAGVDMTWI